MIKMDGFLFPDARWLTKEAKAKLRNDAINATLSVLKTRYSKCKLPMFIGLDEKGVVEAAWVDFIPGWERNEEAVKMMNSDIAEWIRRGRKVIYGYFESVQIGAKLPESEEEEK